MSSPKNEISKEEMRRKDNFIVSSPVDFSFPTDESGHQIQPVEGYNPGLLDVDMYGNPGRILPDMGENYPGYSGEDNRYGIFNLFDSSGSNKMSDIASLTSLRITLVLIVLLNYHSLGF